MERRRIAIKRVTRRMDDSGGHLSPQEALNCVNIFIKNFTVDERTAFSQALALNDVR